MQLLRVVLKIDVSKQNLLETSMIGIPCVIFAGGKSSRMGEDKALLPFATFSTLCEFQYSRLSKIFSHVYISCKDKSKFNFQASFVEDIKSNAIYAPTLGFISSFEYLQCNSFFAISVDAPFIDEETIKILIKNDISSNDATVAQTDIGMQPLCGIYHSSLLKNFKKMLHDENHKLGLLLKNVKTTFVTFENEKTFLNLNHPYDYQEALKRINN